MVHILMHKKFIKINLSIQKCLLLNYIGNIGSKNVYFISSLKIGVLQDWILIRIYKHNILFFRNISIKRELVNK